MQPRDAEIFSWKRPTVLATQSATDPPSPSSLVETLSIESEIRTSSEARLVAVSSLGVRWLKVAPVIVETRALNWSFRATKSVSQFTCRDSHVRGVKRLATVGALQLDLTHLDHSGFIVGHSESYVSLLRLAPL